MQTNNPSVDLTNCEKEPIHIIGKIQPHGVLFAFDYPSLTLCHVSVNAGAFMDVDYKNLPGQSIGNIFDGQTAEKIKQWAHHQDTQNINPLQVTVKYKEKEQIMNALVHCHKHILSVELEPLGDKETFVYSEYNHLLNLAIPKFHQADTVKNLCQSVADQIKVITGYDRVMLYQFDEEWNGEVIAEAKEAHLESFLNLRYPASDIPAQARALFLTNWIRIIPDVDYQSVDIYPALHTRTARPLDLTMSVLRSVSPMHIEYLHNMGVRATLNISIIFKDKLWGLISCHHYSPKFIPYELRTACEFIGRVFSYQLHVKSEDEDKQYAALLKDRKMKLLQQMSDSSDVVAGLNNFATKLLHINNADGAAIYVDGRLVLQGATPSEKEVHTIIGWLQENTPRIFYTNHFAKHFPAAATFKDTASGILAVSISRSLGEYVIWFRKEVVQLVNWAGDPHKAVTVEEDGIRLSPRKSFAKWKEAVYNKSLPWKSCEIDTALTLRENIIEVLLEVFGKIRELNRALERSNINLQAEILERKHAEESLRHAVEMAEEMSKLKNNFFANLSHEFRTPVNGIMGMINIIEDELPNEALKMYTEMVRESSRRLLQTLTSMLEMASIESQTTKFSLTECNLNKALAASVKSLQPLAEKKKISLRYHDPGKQLYSLVDEKLLTQIMSNLIGNGVKFTDAGTVTVSLNHRVQSSGGEMAIITIMDTGIGIDKNFLPRIFLPFEQESKGFDRKYEGAGLGLSITKNLVELFGGRITVESEKGKGSTFTVKFPLHHSEGPEVVESEENKLFRELGASDNENSTPKFNSVLVVEDNLINALAIQSYLKKDFETTWVKNGEEALEAVEQGYFDLILMDINLGQEGLDGVEVMRRIRQKPGFERIPVFAVTGYAMKGDREKFLEAGFDEYCAKPVSKEALLEAIHRVLAAKNV